VIYAHLNNNAPNPLAGRAQMNQRRPRVSRKTDPASLNYGPIDSSRISSDTNFPLNFGLQEKELLENSASYFAGGEFLLTESRRFSPNEKFRNTSLFFC